MQRRHFLSAALSTVAAPGLVQAASSTPSAVASGAHPAGASDVVRYCGVPGRGHPQVYAHRAARGLMPEQTMPAYVGTLRLGADYVDMDVALTRDNVLVITHDRTLSPNLTRDAAGNWITTRVPIREMTLAEVAKYDVGRLKPGTQYASYFPHQRPVDGTPIPTLKEVVRYVKEVAGNQVGFQVEIKTNPERPQVTATPAEFAKAVHQLLVEEAIIDRTEVQAFDWRCLVELARLDPAIKTAYLSDHTTVRLDDAETGLWTAGVLPKDHGYSLPRMIRHLGGYCWEPFEVNLTREALDEAHRLGLKVVVWGWPEQEGTEFSYPTVGKMIDWGVDGIITDRPDILRGLLVARGINVPKGFAIKS